MHISDRFMSRDTAANTYRNTPMWDPNSIPFGFAGSVHIGQGIFATKCRKCEHTELHYGMAPRYAFTGPHEVKVHNMQVAGINAKMMS